MVHSAPSVGLEQAQKDNCTKINQLYTINLANSRKINNNQPRKQTFSKTIEALKISVMDVFLKQK